MPFLPRPTLSCHSRILARLDPLKNLCTSNPEGPLESGNLKKKKKESGNLRANPGLCIAGWGWVLVSGIFLLLHPHFLSKPISPDSLPQRLTCVDCSGLQWTVLPSAFRLGSANGRSIQKTKIMASGPITSWQIDGETVETEEDFILGAPKSLQMVTAAMKLKDACSLEEKL